MIRIKCDVCNEEKSSLSALSDDNGSGKQCCRECRDLITPVIFKGVFSLKEARDTLEFLKFTNKSMDAMFTYIRKKAQYLHEPYEVQYSLFIQKLNEQCIFVLKKELFTLDIKEHHYMLSMFMSNEILDPLYNDVISLTMNDNIDLIYVKQDYTKKFTSWKLSKF
jgi:hypothetical protein